MRETQLTLHWSLTPEVIPHNHIIRISDESMCFLAFSHRYRLFYRHCCVCVCVLGGGDLQFKSLKYQMSTETDFDPNLFGG